MDAGACSSIIQAYASVNIWITFISRRSVDSTISQETSEPNNNKHTLYIIKQHILNTLQFHAYWSHTSHYVNSHLTNHRVLTHRRNIIRMAHFIHDYDNNHFPYSSSQSHLSFKYTFAHQHPHTYSITHEPSHILFAIACVYLILLCALIIPLAWVYAHHLTHHSLD